MERTTRSPKLVSQLWKRIRFDDLGHLRRDLFLSLLPMALGPMGHVHAHPIGRLEHRARLFGSISSVELSLARSSAERPDTNESNVDDVRRAAFDCDGRCRTPPGHPPLHPMDHSRWHLFLRRGHLLYLCQ